QCQLPRTHELSPSVKGGRATRDWYHGHHLIEDGIWSDATHPRRRCDDQTMAEGRLEQRFDVICLDEVPAAQQGKRLGGMEEGERSPRAGAEVDMLVLTGGGDERDDILAQLMLDTHLAHLLLHVAQILVA